MTTENRLLGIEEGPVHVVPVNDLREHNTSALCWCRPVPCEDEPRVIVHNSMDQRELYEDGRLKPH